MFASRPEQYTSSGSTTVAMASQADVHANYGSPWSPMRVLGSLNTVCEPYPPDAHLEQGAGATVASSSMLLLDMPSIQEPQWLPSLEVEKTGFFPTDPVWLACNELPEARFSDRRRRGYGSNLVELPIPRMASPFEAPAMVAQPDLSPLLIVSSSLSAPGAVPTSACDMDVDESYHSCSSNSQPVQNDGRIKRKASCDAGQGEGATSSPARKSRRLSRADAIRHHT
ncbi:hypothetical protein PUNSTDRAFT_146337 [Punctularia strigosozonata HHB-11173 SS5]|uniref:Uncharacterized protein n=1 Tax=Punctularia strigosozonata (strain HHB-11173) TaxID=741275 RepID=R7S382_PUNST|nr:uncharacterized protein PUNSTDRAFT_146337 [Punctularia strigosozonata HHB-11173 SS5]EIN04683.1 hypothetical protein PUNSTDRAFT_146337 [Punctularia strigosozonata HHB-11173 SS5]